jgi:hypothetical protein
VEKLLKLSFLTCFVLASLTFIVFGAMLFFSGISSDFEVFWSSKSFFGVVLMIIFSVPLALFWRRRRLALHMFSLNMLTVVLCYLLSRVSDPVPLFFADLLIILSGVFVSAFSFYCTSSIKENE